MRDRGVSAWAAAIAALAFGVVVSTARQASADVLTLKSSEVLQGTSGGEVDGKVRFTHPVLGELLIPKDQIANLASGEAQETVAKLTAAKKTLEDAGHPVPEKVEEEIKERQRWRLIPGWDTTFEAGFAGAAGNSESLNIYLKFLTGFDNENTAGHIGSTFFYNTSGGDVSTNEFRVFARHDWKWPESRWFWFAQGDFEIDEFEPWAYRITAHTGPGYKLITSEKLTVRLLSGIGGAAEFGGEDGDEIYPEAMAGGELIWKINDVQTITANTFWYPDLSDFPENRVTSAVAWSLLLDKANRLSLKFGVENEYQSKTDDDSDHNDLKAFGALVFDF